MRSVGAFFHAAPSAEFTTPTLGGMQHVWKRVFERVMDRGDTYKRSAFNNLHDNSKLLSESTYVDLRGSHDALSLERDGLIDACHKPANLSLDLVSEAHSYKNRAKLLYKDVLKALESAPPSPPSSRQDSLGSYRFPGSPPPTPPTDDFLPPSGYLIHAQRAPDSSLSVNMLDNDTESQSDTLERFRSLNGPVGEVPPEANRYALSCPSLAEDFVHQQYHMYMHEDIQSSGTITIASQRSSDEDSRSDRISASEIVELLDTTDGEINVDAVVDLLQMAEGSADEALLSHAVEAMRKRYGKAVADRLQSELDDRVRASSSSGVKSIALKSDLSGLP